MNTVHQTETSTSIPDEQRPPKQHPEAPIPSDKKPTKG
jgi:hypothetical protein